MDQVIRLNLFPTVNHAAADPVISRRAGVVTENLIVNTAGKISSYQ
jgi:hypothetical protein